MNSNRQERLTEESIAEIYHQVLCEVSAILPVGSWAHKPAGLKWTSRKRAYGTALEDGTIEINRIFLDSHAREHIDIVFRHEFAHLAVGLSHGHGRLFRRLERRFGVVDRYGCKVDINELAQKQIFKYTLIAYLANGSCFYTDVHRKSKRYLEYGKNKRICRVKGVVVLRFEYVDYFKR